MQGIILIDKPIGYTSQDVVSKIKKILNIKKAGHTGTLDPMATGLLPVLIGNYTKLSKYLIEHNKTYIAKIKFGIETETGDLEGKKINSCEVDKNIFNKEYIENILKSFLGKQEQYPPMYSAIKVNGKKLYEYARAGIDVKVEPREINIHNINLLNVDKDNLEIEFEVSCSKGTYIRSLCADIAKKMNTIGVMCSLRRTSVDKFKIENAITLEILEKNKENLNFIESNLITMEEVFKDLNKINLNDKKKTLFLNGVMLTHKLQDGLYNIYDEKNNYIGTGTIKNNLLKRDIILEN